MRTRREFIVSLGGGALGAAAMRSHVAEALAADNEDPLYPPIDLSYFDSPIAPAPSNIQFGYAAITWDNHDLQAIEDIAAVGFPGIQIRSPILEQFGSRPAALREMLAQRHLTFVALSSGNVKYDPAIEKQVIEEHTSHAKFVHDAGGLYLQVTDERPKGRPIAAADYTRAGRLLTEIGKRTADLGVPLGYHNHMNSLGEKPEEVDRILDAADPRYVKLELDVAHYQQGGGDPVSAIRKYAGRHLFFHLKDVESPRPDRADDPKSYRWVELGRGRVNLPAVLAAIDDIKFRGWVIVELDTVPDKSRTPKECAENNRKYLEDHGYRKNLHSH
ncbi:MAG TPA: sugar phosphate isomerase/epimerase [Vicinamibacterales bacterium]|nr:sugar phosphate isomerase/epimerase [Vicinamibacterales bacterium]